MSDKLFSKIIAVILVLGIIGTVALAGYTVYLRKNASITSYISNESK